MNTNQTTLDGLLDDDMPTAMTASPHTEQQTRSAEPRAAITPVAPANPDDDATVETRGNAESEPSATERNDAEKLVIVEGQTFLVDAAIDNETIRDHLVRQGFANLAGAEVRTGTRQQNGKTIATVDFIKRAGTKG